LLTSRLVVGSRLVVVTSALVVESRLVSRPSLLTSRLSRVKSPGFQKSYLPATKKSYLNSMKHFCKYALDTNVGDDKVIGTMHNRVSSWISTRRKEFGKHQQQKSDSDLNKLVKPEDVAKFQRSELVTMAIKLIGTSADVSRHAQMKYITVRDYLLVEIALNNANRSGVLANMTTNEFMAARLVDGQYVVSVSEHKTATTYGAAKIVLTPSLLNT